MRGALFATAAMNIVGAALFAPSARALRAVAGFPEAEHPLYLATVSMFVLLFGVGYLWAAIAGRAGHAAGGGGRRRSSSVTEATSLCATWTSQPAGSR